jgi:hypothetical protein
MRDPTFAFGTVVILSIMSLHGARKPLSGSGTMSSRSKGASVGSVVKAQIVIDAVDARVRELYFGRAA